ncbi:uncharacterized protein LOC119739497 [Patiria miniata]|uniref:SHSP domain-containing protein n=1 Tax=Patiria miniata TaxID=46514 RepID=A0A914B4I9_PATMI|nr:uncharacterized protein LOC119739497 [Patiria miniata]
MSEKEGKKCPFGFGEGGSGHGSCPYGFGTGGHGHHGPGFGHGGPGHCPYLQGHGHGHGHFGPGFGGPPGFGPHGFGHHGFDHHGGKPPMLQCPWMVARLHACPWAWGVGSGHHACKSGKSCDFCVTLKVADFCSEELEVKVVGQEVIVHGKHEPRPDPADASTVSREFTRRYELPDNIDLQTVASSLNDDHELIITATKKVAEGEPRVVPIQVGEGSGDH